jgi:hypothetical protein
MFSVAGTLQDRRRSVMSDRDGLRRRAEVLQRVADQLSAQLRVERWSNGELRKLLGEPVGRRGIDDDGLAARRFLTFASVAILTAAAVALLVSRPWRGADFVATRIPVMAPSVAGSAMGGTIVPFTIVDRSEVGTTLVGVDAIGSSGENEGSALDLDEVFGRPATRVQLTPGTPRRHRATLGVGVYDLFGPARGHGADDVP